MKKQLGFFDVFAICSGSMISSGLFILPALAAAKVGPMVIAAYALSGVLLIPAMFSTAEMATAMPRMGGTYFFISRILGGMFGTIDGIGVWFALMLKTSIALLGLGAYISLFVSLSPQVIAVIITLVFMFLNIVGTKEATVVQNVMVLGLLAILGLLVVKGVPAVSLARFSPFAPHGWGQFLPTVALVFVSYIGVTKVASVAEEVKNAERNIPYGMITALIVVGLLYIAAIFVAVGVLPLEALSTTLSPLSDAARVAMGSWGAHVVSLAAALAFATTANAGIVAGSRYLVAMSKDTVMPQALSKTSSKGVPYVAILFTSLMVIVFVSTAGFERIAKLASTFQLLVFALVNISVIVMRESGLASYDPGFKSPWYPYMQIVGVIISAVLIPEMGIVSSIFAFALIGVGVLWYYFYVLPRTDGRVGAVAKMAERLAEKLLARDANVMGLRSELRQIIKEKKLREGDPFFALLKSATVLEVPAGASAKQVIEQGATMLAQKGGVAYELILGAMLERNRLGETPVSAGVALPHVQLDDYEQSHMVVLRSKDGVSFENSITEGRETIHAVFMLLGSSQNPTQHLRILAEIARRAETPRFMDAWLACLETNGLITLLEAPVDGDKKA